MSEDIVTPFRCPLCQRQRPGPSRLVFHSFTSRLLEQDHHSLDGSRAMYGCDICVEVVAICELLPEMAGLDEGVLQELRASLLAILFLLRRAG